MDENENKEEQIKKIKQDIKTIKVEPFVWTSLKSLKKENETFNDVIWNLMKESTKEIGNENVKLMRYGRKVLFININLENKKNYGMLDPIGIEFEYNDVKNQQSEFILELKFKKIFYGKTTTNPSIFFGVDEKHKHLSSKYLTLYLNCVALALKKEFGILRVDTNDLELIAKWRKIYYDYGLSEESFIEDIETPLDLSLKDAPITEQKNNMLNSPSEKGW